MTNNVIFPIDSPISQLFLHYFGKLKYYTLGKRNYIRLCVQDLSACEKPFSNVILYVHPLQREASHLPFHHALMTFCSSLKLPSKGLTG